jgi:hypothetical protein
VKKEVLSVAEDEISNRASSVSLFLNCLLVGKRLWKSLTERERERERERGEEKQTSFVSSFLCSEVFRACELLQPYSFKERFERTVRSQQEQHSKPV